MSSVIADPSLGVVSQPPTMDYLMERLGRIPLSRVLTGFALDLSEFFGELDRVG